MNAILPIRSTESIRHAIRRLRWFKTTFGDQARRLEKLGGLEFALDDAKLARVFVAWLRAFEEQKKRVLPLDREDFVYFSAGLMLSELIRLQPAVAGAVPEGADPELPLYFWPEGYLYASFCLSVCLTVVEQEFDEQVELAPCLSDIRTWQSFRENAAEDAGIAVAFLDRFVGKEPNWLFPGFFAARAGRAPRRISGG